MLLQTRKHDHNKLTRPDRCLPYLQDLVSQTVLVTEEKTYAAERQLRLTWRAAQRQLCQHRTKTPGKMQKHSKTICILPAAAHSATLPANTTGKCPFPLSVCFRHNFCKSFWPVFSRKCRFAPPPPPNRQTKGI